MWMKEKLSNWPVDLYAAFFMALFVLVMAGSTGEGQASVFQYFVREYIEESSASLASVIRDDYISADNQNFITAQGQGLGQGGENIPQSVSLELTSIQQSSVIAYAPPVEDYINSAGLGRSGVIEYAVQPGDLLSFIASDYGVSVESIMWANGLRNADALTLGQVLKIPPVSGVIHKIRTGETVSSIAKKYGIEEEQIISFNGLPKDGRLDSGDEIVIPGGRPAAVAVAPSSAASAAVKRFSYLPNLGDYFMLPTVGSNWGRIHGRNGVDVANSCGTSIYAAADGTVVTADGTGWNGGFGKFVKIAHPNGTETVYAHGSKIHVITGQAVTRGQLIMAMGTTGRSTGCHLHFEVHGAKNPLVKS